jgi:hypothetical protein
MSDCFYRIEGRIRCRDCGALVASAKPLRMGQFDLWCYCCRSRHTWSPHAGYGVPAERPVLAGVGIGSCNSAWLSSEPSENIDDTEPRVLAVCCDRCNELVVLADPDGKNVQACTCSNCGLAFAWPFFPDPDRRIGQGTVQPLLPANQPSRHHTGPCRPPVPRPALPNDDTCDSINAVAAIGTSPGSCSASASASAVPSASAARPVATPDVPIQPGLSIVLNPAGTVAVLASIAVAWFLLGYAFIIDMICWSIAGILVGLAFGRAQAHLLQFIAASMLAGFVSLGLGSVTGLSGSGWLADLFLGGIGAVAGSVILSRSR